MLKRGFSFAPGYRLESFLGRGQFGQVWRATAPGGAVAAVKFIDLSGGEGAKEHEGIKRVKQIRHANLMPITAIWLLDEHGKAIEEAPNVTEETINLKGLHDPLATADSLPSMPSSQVSQPGPLEATGMVTMPQPEAAWLAVAMLLGGKSLQHRLRECVKNGLPGIPPKELIAYMDESAKGLDFLNIPQHDLGEGMVAIQHCDVKPANIVLLGSSAVVCDFGLARILSRNQVTATSAAGTPAYMAPEAIAGRPCKSSDQYSLAVTYYHLRTGTLPISDGTLWEVLDAHKTGKLDLSRVPEMEQAVIKRATSLDWEKRYDSNLDFVDSLREALRVEGHTKPIPIPVGSRVSSPGTMPTGAIDPSMTLMPGQDITTPAVAVAVDPEGPTLEIKGGGDTKDEKAISAAAHPAVVIPPVVPAWWQQPKWLATAAAVVLTPLLAYGAMSVGSNGNTEKQPNNGGESPPEIVEPPIVTQKTSAEWLADAAAKLTSDEAVARTSFEEALKLDPSLLQQSPVLLLGHNQGVVHVVFSGDATQLVSVADAAPSVWALSSMSSRGIGDQPPPVKGISVGESAQLINAIAVDPTGKMFATADYDGNLTVTSFADFSKPIVELKVADSDLTCLAWHPSSSYIFAAVEPQAILFTAPQTVRGQEQHRFDIAGLPIKDIAIDPQGRWLLVLQDKGIVSKVAWSEIESSIKTNAAPQLTPITSDGTRVSVMQVCRTIQDTESAIVTGGELGEITIRFLDSDTKEQRHSIHTTNVTAIAVSSLGLAGPIASSDDDGEIGIWRAGSQQPILKRTAHKASITAMDMSADGRWLAVSSFDGDVTLWDLSSDDLPMTKMTSNAGPANCVKLDSSGRWLAVGHENGNVALWDLRHAKLLVGKTIVQEQEAPKPELKTREDDNAV